MALLSVVGCGHRPTVSERINAGATADTGLQFKTITTGGKSYNYAVFIPPSYTPTKAWPLIVYLHGLGEAGKDGKAQTTVGLGPQIARDPKTFPFVVLMPQSPNRWKSPQMLDAVMAMMTQTRKDLKIDVDRIIVSGYSMGGEGAWLMAARWPERFAACVPMAAFDALSSAPRLKNMPVWAFHNVGDPVVGVQETRAMVEALKSAGNTNVQYTEYKVIGHDCWTAAYNDPKLLRWMLQQRWRGASAEAAKKPSEPTLR